MEANDGGPPGDDGAVAWRDVCPAVKQPMRCLLVEAVHLWVWTVLDAVVLCAFVLVSMLVEERASPLRVCCARAVYAQLTDRDCYVYRRLVRLNAARSRACTWLLRHRYR